MNANVGVSAGDVESAGAPGIRVAVVTLVSGARLDRARAQWAALDAAGAGDAAVYAVWLDVDAPPADLVEPAELTEAADLMEPADLVEPAELAAAPDARPATSPATMGRRATVLHVPPGHDGLRLAAGRNAGAAAAIADGADLLVFLDADCIAGRDLFARYFAASLDHPDAVLCGPVTYLPEGFDYTGPAGLAAATAPHPARPAPPAGETVVAGELDYRLFWSLSFAVTAYTWQRTGAFFEGYEGYGGEDTDFGSTLAERGIPLVWVGGAHAYHQYHPTSSPPWQHLDDILRNAELYFRRWGRWPMEGWLSAFAEAGAISWREGRWVRSPAALQASAATAPAPAPRARDRRPPTRR
ncbi:glycosyltransferase family 2 protein [Subtercola sp. YIM 133946]|uniref:glycosyltransferase family 2 protein n=1 Tax=Subtercola sp. YIM 133946 TaxID=3118909 RepID=UPI002F936765